MSMIQHSFGDGLTSFRQFISQTDLQIAVLQLYAHITEGHAYSLVQYQCRHRSSSFRHVEW